MPLINNVLGATSKLQDDLKVVSLSFSNVLIALGNLSTHAVSSQGKSWSKVLKCRYLGSYPLHTYLYLYQQDL